MKMKEETFKVGIFVIFPLGNFWSEASASLI